MRFWSSRLVVFGMLAGLLVAASAGCDLLTQLYGDDEGNLVQPPIATRGTLAGQTGGLRDCSARADAG